MKKFVKALTVSAVAFGAVASVTVPASAAPAGVAGYQQQFDLSSMDIESALLAVQQSRANALAQANPAQTGDAQLDMLRMQAMNNKRNEAFDLMTDFIKKMQDSRSSILGNMR